MADRSGQLKELHAAILSGFDINELIQIVRFEMGDDLKSMVAVDKGLDAVVFLLLEKIEKRGTTDVLAAAVCKARPSNPLIRAYAEKYLASAVASRSPAAMAAEVTAVLQSVADGAQVPGVDGKVKAVVLRFANELAAASLLTNLLRQYKVLHDQLHIIDHRLLGVIKSAAALFRGDEDQRLALSGYTGELRDCVTAAESAARKLSFAQAELGWILNIEQAATLLEAAVAVAKPAAGEGGGTERRALALLRTVVGREPARINGQMMLLAGQLQAPLDGLTRAMSDLELADATRAQAIRGARSAAEALRPRLQGLVVEHDAWQRIDNQLRLVPDSALQPLDDVMIIWPDLSRAANDLCDPRREAVWASSLKAAARRFDVAMVTGITGDQRLALAEFARLARKRFFDVDHELDVLCSSLVQIADPLTELLGLIGR